MQNKKTVIRNSILVIIILLVVLVVILSLNDLTKIVQVLQSIDLRYLSYATLLTILYWITWSLSLTFIMINYKTKMKMFDCFLISGSDLFFNGITPFNSGGQPFQVYLMKKGGMKVSDGTSVVMTKTIIYQIAIVLVSTIALIIGYQRASTTDLFMILVFVGYFMNCFILVLLILLSTCKWAKRAFLGIFDLLGKIKPLKNFFANKRTSFIKYTDDFQKSFIALIKTPIKLLGSLLLQIFNLIIMFMITFFILKAINHDGFNISYSELPYVVSISAMNAAFMCWLPTPGAAGGAEFGLQTLLITVSGVTTEIAVSVLLLWRFFTYYLSMIYGLIVTLIVEHRLKKHYVELETEEITEIEEIE